jgi:hypothetical protein
MPYFFSSLRQPRDLAEDGEPKIGQRRRQGDEPQPTANDTLENEDLVADIAGGRGDDNHMKLLLRVSLAK